MRQARAVGRNSGSAAYCAEWVKSQVGYAVRTIPIQKVCTALPYLAKEEP